MVLQSLWSLENLASYRVNAHPKSEYSYLLFHTNSFSEYSFFVPFSW